ncbi:MAG: hypothetical protein ACI4PU_03860 [Intestinibacter sp.]
METILLILSVGLLIILSFFIGARVGQKVVNKEDIKLPNPIQVVKSYEQKKEEEEEYKKLQEDLEKINNYDGNI